MTDNQVIAKQPLPNHPEGGNDDGRSPSLPLPREGMLMGANSKGNGFNSLASEASVNSFNFFNS